MLLLFAGFQLEDIDDIGIGTAEAEVSVLACGQIAAIAQDIDIGESHVHGHGAERAPLGIKVEGVSDLVTAVAAAGSFLIHQGDCNLRFFHDSASISSNIIQHNGGEQNRLLPLQHISKKIIIIVTL